MTNWIVVIVPCATTVLIEKINREKKVVVPTRIQTIFPKTNQETKALQSSIFQGRTLRIENHLKRTFSRDQNPVAAASSSSFVGRCVILGMCGRWRYFPGGVVASGRDSVFFSAPNDGSRSSFEDVWLLALFEVELLCLFKFPLSLPRALECSFLVHACRAPNAKSFGYER